MSRENKILTFAVLLFVGGLVTYGWTLYSKGPTLPVLGTIEPFQLDHVGRGTFDSAKMTGQVWVTDFIFTSCGGICVDMSAGMEILQSRIRDLSPVKLVSVSVDPKYDTIEALKGYADRHHADPERWYFLRGEMDAIKDVAANRFKVGDKNDAINHSNKFVLVDGKGQIRGYYNGSGIDKDAELKRLERDLRSLVSQLDS